MKVTQEKIENSQAFLTVEMESAEMGESIEDAYQRLAKKANIPGFRKGKAPRSILEHYMGKESVLEEAIKHLLPQAYEQAIKEQEIEPFTQPDIEITQTDPLIFKATVPLSPAVELGDYQSIRLTPDPVETTGTEETGKEVYGDTSGTAKYTDPPGESPDEVAPVETGMGDEEKT